MAKDEKYSSMHLDFIAQALFGIIANPVGPR
jgi:hypothetical protein